MPLTHKWNKYSWGDGGPESPFQAEEGNGVSDLYTTDRYTNSFSVFNSSVFKQQTSSIHVSLHLPEFIGTHIFVLDSEFWSILLDIKNSNPFPIQWRKEWAEYRLNFVGNDGKRPWGLINLCSFPLFLPMNVTRASEWCPVEASSTHFGRDWRPLYRTENSFLIFFLKVWSVFLRIWLATHLSKMRSPNLQGR